MNSSEPHGNKRLNNSESPLRRVLMDASCGQRNNENESINANTAEKGIEMLDKAETIDIYEQ